MSLISRFLSGWLVILSAAPGCQAGQGTAPDDRLRIYRFAGSSQCDGAGSSLAAMRRNLEDSGIHVLEASCGYDGRIYPSSCGSPDGRINIFLVGKQHAAPAKKLGFLPLAELPDAVESSCPAK